MVVLFNLLPVVALLLDGANGDLYFMVEKAKAFQCGRGGSSGLSINERDVRVTDTRGRELHYISAPGDFVIHFDNINLGQNLQNLAGEISVNLQVPLGSGGPFNLKWDIPYSAVPQKKLIGGFTCDEGAGYVKSGDKNLCRFCDLCKSTEKIERELAGGHKVLPQLGGAEKMFSTICAEVRPGKYSLTRTVSLPSKQELQDMVRQRYQGMDAGLQSKFKIGEAPFVDLGTFQNGKFQVYMNLISSPQPPIDANSFYSSQKGCQCCVEGGRGGLFCRGCKEKCKSAYAEQCLGSSAQSVACYTVEFNFRASENYGDVQQFLRENNFQDTGASSSSSSGGGFNQGSSTPGGGGGGFNAGGQQSCIDAIASPTYKRYCQARWNPSFCCNLCPGMC